MITTNPAGRRNQLDAVLRRLYEVICFDEGGAPNLTGMAELFLPHARVTRVSPEGRDDLTITGFQDMLHEMLEDGIYTSFFEVETARRVELFGAVAHVLSAYETKRSADAADVLGRGINSLQLVYENSDWKILSLLWDEGSYREPVRVERFQALEVSYG